MSNKELKPTKKPSKQGILMLVMLIVATVVVLTFYRVMMNFSYFEIVLIAYMVITLGLVVVYVIYNRGFSRRGLTAEMLPDEWSEERKNALIEDGKRRQHRSRWMIIPIFAFIFTFGVDMVELFMIPFIRNLFT